MESHRVAVVAAEMQAPFAVLRAVADPAGRALPRAALAGLGSIYARTIRRRLAVLIVAGQLLAAVGVAARWSATISAMVTSIS